MDSSTYRHLSGELKKNCFIPHYNFPSHNLLSVETLPKVFKDFKNDQPNLCSDSSNFPFYQKFPYAVHLCSVLFCGSCVTDDAFELVRRKLNWERELKKHKVSNIDEVVKTIKRLKDNKVVNLSYNLKKYLEHFRCDPEPMFSGEYNWLYTGGSLCYNENSKDTYIISGDFIVNKPGLNLLLLNKSQNKVLQKSFCQLKAYSPVLQVTCRSHFGDLIICVRQKNYLSLFNANTMKSLTQPVRLWRKKVSGSKLLTCVDVEASCEKLVITDSSHDINIFHTERKNKIYGYPGRNIASNLTEDAWSQVEFGELGVYWALRNRFVIFDVRDFPSSFQLNLEFSSATYPCEKISSFSKSRSDPNIVYLGTNHSVLQVDLRNKKAVQKWTHLMKNPPQFMATIKDKEENEVLLLQSASVDEILGITNERYKIGENVNFVSKSLPCLLKSIKESLNLARTCGICLSPSVAKRIDFSVTGMQCLKNNQGDINLFITNSGGDVFLSRIGNKTLNSFSADENERIIIEEMKIYESHLEKFPKQSFKNNFELVDMSQVLLDSQNSRKGTAKAEVYWRYHEMYSLNSLKFFQDFLAQKILNVWVPESENKNQDIKTEMKSIEAKVLEWMANW